MRLSKGALHALAVLSVALATEVPALSDSFFTFDSDTSLKATPFTDTNNGMSATFTDPLVAGGFAIRGLFGQFDAPFSGNLLIASYTPAQLNVSFSQGLQSVSLDFATSGAGPFSLTALEGATVVGTASMSGAIPAGFTFPQGVISFDNGAVFNNIELSFAGGEFAIDNVHASAAVPEPMSMLLLSTVLAIAGVPLHRKLTSRR